MLWGVKIWLWWLLVACIAFTAAMNAPWLVWHADHHEGLAAWVQAVGVFAAVFLAGWLSSRQATREIQISEELKRREMVVKARSLTMLLLPEIKHIRDSAVLKENRLAHWPRARGFPNASKIVIAPILEDAVFGMEVDSDEFESIARVVVSTRTYNHLLDTVHSLNLNEQGVSTMRANMQEKRALVVSACERVIGIFG